MMGTLLRRNRFKNKTKEAKRRFKWPAFLRDWRLYVRRGGLVLTLVGALSALAWALDRPVRVISIDGSFQRVSPGQIERAIRVLRQGDRQLGVRDGRVPVASAEVGVTEMSQTWARIG